MPEVRPDLRESFHHLRALIWTYRPGNLSASAQNLLAPFQLPHPLQDFVMRCFKPSDNVIKLLVSVSTNLLHGPKRPLQDLVDYVPPE